MTKNNLLILEEDKQAARNRIEELEAEILALGPEFYEVFNQTSETWHDNAPFEAVRDRQSLLAAEMAQLKSILANSLPSIPAQKQGIVGIGSTVTVSNHKHKEILYRIAGDWTPHAGRVHDGVTTISRQSPLAVALLGKKAGDTVDFKTPLTVVAVD